MKYVKLLRNNEVVELRMQLASFVIVRHQNGDTEKVAYDKFEPLDLVDA